MLPFYHYTKPVCLYMINFGFVFIILIYMQIYASNTYLQSTLLSIMLCFLNTIKSYLHLTKNFRVRLKQRTFLFVN